MTENITISIQELHYEELLHNYTSHPAATTKKNIPSILSKRKYEDAFGSETFDDERYGQHISNNYFEKSIGHDVHYKVSNKTVINAIYDVDELLDWCNKYLASKKKL
jgi:hypothetical protein